MYEINQQELSQHIARSDWQACWAYLFKLLESCDENKKSKDEIMGDFARPDGIQKIYNFSETVSKIFIALLTDSRVTISDENYINLIQQHELLHAFFYIVSIEQTDSYVQHILSANRKLTADQQKKLCLLLSLNTNLEIVSVLKNVALDYRGVALTAYFANRKNFFGNHEANKIKLLVFKEDILKMQSLPAVIHKFNHAYFNVSYIEHDEKHEIKKYLNRQIRKYIASNRKFMEEHRDAKKIPSDDAVKSRKKPVLLISSEHLSSGHAMYRSWGRRLRTMQEYFDVHLLIHSKSIDDTALADFENYFFTDGKTFDQIIFHIEYLRPDVIFMPSIGMNIVNIMLSNIRLAPLQVMGLGHPATSMSHDIDFVLGRKEVFSASGFRNDRYVIDPSPIEHHPLTFFKNIKIARQQDGIGKDYVVVGIPGALQKMSHHFWAFLEKIYKEADFKIRYVFLTDAKGYNAAAAKIYALKRFPDCGFYGFQSYEDYYAHITRMDLALFPFPFGHANTVVDTLIAGKPCIGLEGDEPHGKAVGTILGRFGLKEDFLTYSIEEYEEKFYALSRQIMAGKRDFFDPQDVYHKIYEETGDQVNFGAYLYWVYKNHEEMKQSPKRLFLPPSDLTKPYSSACAQEC